MVGLKTYSIQIIPTTDTMGRGDAPFHISLTTNDIEYSMEQWGRNRPPFSYKILEVKDEKDD
jgi:hypothetical protein